ncbi:Receptor like protein kinase S.2 [Apostasia shenzhenica]|uniref:Receptor like protein kinase S.2 n=1 Tax=Apostasia shenzhenica TaxID=1088818 RepID=A0A2I0AQG0_9ASPA|nr:Receptor like protein kinase S.2 [Apostasia shenzhenica]PKA57789.1 Receptor like protein kinase S.2 [Apostasia shenzhenica]
MRLERLCCIPTAPAVADEDDRAGENDAAPPKKSTKSRRRRLTLHCFLCRRIRRSLSSHSDRFHDAPGTTLGNGGRKDGAGSCRTPRIFTYAELYIGTRGFSKTELLGSGGFGRVYRAALPSDGSVVAVKCIAGSSDHGLEKSFAAELVAVAQLRHRNLVPLRGWCIHDRQLLLVYEYMPNRSLDRLLFAAPAVLPLGWERRRKIIFGLAAALFYLHEQLDTQIIHRDVKASNVMLDSGYNARLGDFGLARWIEHSEASLPAAPAGSKPANNYDQFRITETSRIGGTIGYIPPESFQRLAAATAKSDVFSFGVVILEVATGRRAVNLAYPDDKIFMLDWVRQLADDGELLTAGDKRLPAGSYLLAEMQRLLHLGLLCSLHEPQSRPTTKWVTETLAGDITGDLPALPSFRSQPVYFSLSSSSGSTTVTSSLYLTAAGTTKFLTAENEIAGSQRDATPFPTVDTPREISYKEIVGITNNFSKTRTVAELDFGTGYQGLMENRFHVLVKRMGWKTCPALRARFSDELNNISHLRHRHLVQLRGWCTDHGEMLVVYDYPSGGVLSRRLFDLHHAALSWRQRYRIVKSLASAVLYLHEEWDEQVIHRNITSSAVFLDPDMSPRLGCFALAEFLSRSDRGGCDRRGAKSPARGIFGYMSPEYMESGRATAAADVYSFGVVVLEILSGRAAVDLRRLDALLVGKARAWEASGRPAVVMADGRMGGRFEGKEMERLVRLGAACTRSEAGDRPTMRQIASILDGNDEALMKTGGRREGKGEWEAKNNPARDMVRRMKALGIQ